MTNENAETIRIDVDSTQFETCMAGITEAVKEPGAASLKFLLIFGMQ